MLHSIGKFHRFSRLSKFQGLKLESFCFLEFHMLPKLTKDVIEVTNRNLRIRGRRSSKEMTVIAAPMARLLVPVINPI